MINCPKCGKIILEDAKRCPYCGADRTASAPSAEKPNRMIVLLILAAVVVLLGIGWLLYHFIGQGGSSPAEITPTATPTVTATPTATATVAPTADPWAGDVLRGEACGFQSDVTVQLTLDANGAIAAIAFDTSDETDGIGSRVGEDTAFAEQFIGKTGPFTVGEGIDAVSGATVTSKGAVEAVNIALGLEPTATPTATATVAPTADPWAGDVLRGEARGFQSDVTVQLTLGTNGAIAAIAFDTSSETDGIGSRVGEDAAFAEQFIGKTGPFTAGEGIDAVSGATVTSRGAVEAVNIALGLEPTATPTLSRSDYPMLMKDTPSTEALNGEADSYVLGSRFLRSQVGNIFFSGSLAEAPADAWDVSADRNGSVKAWLVMGGDGLYDLHIAGNDGVQLPTDSDYLFGQYTEVKDIHFGACVSTANVTNMRGMFFGCASLTTLDVSGFDTGNATNMSAMFLGCPSLTSLDVSGFNTGNVTNMSYMFSDCSSLTSLDVSCFDTGNVTNMCAMFYECSGLTTLDVSGFDTAMVTDMSMMFLDCSSLTSLDVSGFTTSKVTDMGWMFKGCAGLTALNLTSFETANVTDMTCMFWNCTGLTSLDLTGFHTIKVTEMGFMFYDCPNLQSIRVSRRFVIPANSEDMFFGCPAGGVIYE